MTSHIRRYRNVEDVIFIQKVPYLAVTAEVTYCGLELPKGTLTVGLAKTTCFSCRLSFTSNKL